MWDALGARRAGLPAGWAGRFEGRLALPLGRADAEGPDLEEVAGRLPRLPVARPA